MHISYISLSLNTGQEKGERNKATSGLQPPKSKQQEYYVCLYVVIKAFIAVMTGLDPFIVVATAPREVNRIWEFKCQHRFKKWYLIICKKAINIK